MTHQSFFKDPKYTRKKKKKGKTKEESEYMSKVGALSCYICGDINTEIHHKTGGGMGLKSSNYDIISLCVNHHRGQDGIHTIGRKEWEERYGTQDEMIEETKGRVIAFI